MPTLRFTKRSVEALPHPKTGQDFYRDEVLRGFGVRVGSKSKVYFVEGQVAGRTRRATIGRSDVIAVDEARKRALSILSGMATGVDPNAEMRRIAQETITLGQAFDRFFSMRKNLADSTRDRYQRTVNLYLKDWKQIPIIGIGRQMVLKRHQKIANAHGEVTANTVRGRNASNSRR